nr:hypothetical protein [Tanacetum cinerariifolium]
MICSGESANGIRHHDYEVEWEYFTIIVGFNGVTKTCLRKFKVCVLTQRNSSYAGASGETSLYYTEDPFLKSSEFNAEHYATLVALPAPFHKYPEPFLCLVGISSYYTLDEDAYPEFLGDNDEGGCDLALSTPFN